MHEIGLSTLLQLSISNLELVSCYVIDSNTSADTTVTNDCNFNMQHLY